MAFNLQTVADDLSRLVIGMPSRENKQMLPLFVIPQTSSARINRCLRKIDAVALRRCFHCALVRQRHWDEPEPTLADLVSAVMRRQQPPGSDSVDKFVAKVHASFHRSTTFWLNVARRYSWPEEDTTALLTQIKQLKTNLALSCGLPSKN